MNNEICILTSNEKKAQDFLNFGFKVKKFTNEIIEVLSPDVEEVVLYKAHDTFLNNIIVEDTSLSVEDADFFGTQIKHVYDEIKNNNNFNYKKAIWEVSLCLKKDDNFYIATGKLEGVLKYPELKSGYHFDRLFAIKDGENYVHFDLLTNDKKQKLGPRFKALKILSEALKTNNYDKLKVIPIMLVNEWKGEYQIEKPVKKYKF